MRHTPSHGYPPLWRYYWSVFYLRSQKPEVNFPRRPKTGCFVMDKAYDILTPTRRTRNSVLGFQEAQRDFDDLVTPDFPFPQSFGESHSRPVYR
jgi:hypothetical protein